MSKHFWENKPLSELTTEEWESICMNCGKCCLLKLQDEETEEIYYTDLACKYFDSDTCHCTQYANRCKLVPACLKLTPQNVDQIPWMPKTCAYRFLFENRSLPAWHPLLTGTIDESHTVKNRCISEILVGEEDLEDHIIEWDEL